MKFISLTAAAALVAFGGVAFAETNAAGTNGDNPPHFGEKWTGMIGSQIFTDTTVTTLRPDADVLTAWQAMTEEQKAMIKADCDMANADSTASAAATDNTSTGTDSQSSDAGGQAAGSGDASAGSGNSNNGGTDASPTTAPVFVSQENMMKLCKIVAP